MSMYYRAFYSKKAYILCSSNLTRSLPEKLEKNIQRVRIIRPQNTSNFDVLS